MATFKDPKVTILAATERDPIDAAALLIFTKSTRLMMSPGGLEATVQKCKSEPEWMASELDYMSKTIRSSWEFLDITFLVENVSRACAQQITRTRQASYAMQSQRVTNMETASFSRIGIYENADLNAGYERALDEAMEEYGFLVDNGMNLEDARGVLPMNIQCNLVEKYNLRTLASLIPARTSYRAQGEYQEVARQMRARLFEMWPWAEVFFRPRAAIAERLLEELGDYILNADTLDAHQVKILIAKVRDQISAAE